MNADFIITVILIALLGYGFWGGWKQLTQGCGLLGGHLPQKAIVWLNKKQVGSVAVKVGISVVLAYVFAFLSIATVLLSFIAHVLRQ